jgi:hypothetical protein
MKTIKEVQKKTFKILSEKLKKAGLAELQALEIQINKHYTANTLSVSQFAKLDVKIMEALAKFECLV